MSRSKGARKPCDLQQARRRFVDARQFLEAADAASCVRWAKQLLAAAQARLEA